MQECAQDTGMWLKTIQLFVDCVWAELGPRPTSETAQSTIGMAHEDMSAPAEHHSQQHAHEPE